uniref:Immunoglobulin V-set domain-containing protein n=1 Tax=Lates calcarifer TaxID=8187 RepID=A0A4W6EDC2_LATCA
MSCTDVPQTPMNISPLKMKNQEVFSVFHREIQGAKLNTPPSRNEYRINRATVSDSGDYRCRGRKDYSLTQWSNVIRLTVSCKLDVFYQLSENVRFYMYRDNIVALSCSSVCNET